MTENTPLPANGPLPDAIVQVKSVMAVGAAKVVNVPLWEAPGAAANVITYVPLVALV